VPGGTGTDSGGEIAVLTEAGILTAIYFYLQRWNLDALLAGKTRPKEWKSRLEEADG